MYHAAKSGMANAGFTGPDNNLHGKMVRLVAFIVMVSVVAAAILTHLTFTSPVVSRYWVIMSAACGTSFVISLCASLYIVRLHLVLHRTHSDLARTARLDPLTGLLNRSAFHEAAQSQMIAGQFFAIVLCDLDHFKAVNDRLGHGAGDLALRHCAHILDNHNLPNGVAGRHGGEEFVLAASGSDEQAVLDAVEKLRREIEGASLLSSGQRFSLTASFGVANWNGSESLEALIHRADVALYRAKADGRNRLSLAA